MDGFVSQKMCNTKCPNRPNPNRSRPPTPQIQNRKLPVNFAELISFLSIVEVGSKAWLCQPHSRISDSKSRRNRPTPTHPDSLRSLAVLAASLPRVPNKESNLSPTEEDRCAQPRGGPVECFRVPAREFATSDRTAGTRTGRAFRLRPWGICQGRYGPDLEADIAFEADMF
jgi:hypothetical protein